jgi:glycosyltransferase involved in cell wall biosynthesis
VIYHEHDSPNPREEDKLQSLIVWARGKLLCDASLVIFPNELRLRRAQKWSGSDATARVVWNCSSIKELGSVDVVHSNAIDENQPLSLYYHGTLVPERLPLTILDGISKCDAKIELTLVGYTTIGSSSYDKIMREYASELGIGDLLHFKGALPTRNDVMAECCKHDAGLVLFTGENWKIYANEMAGASNKPFDYLSQGISVLVPDLPIWKELFVNNSCAIEANPDDAESLAELFDWLAHNRKEAHKMGRKGREMIEIEWNYEKQFQPVLEWIESATH